MKTILSLILIILSFSGLCRAEILGDINQDGKVGIPEAIYALEVTAGIAQPTAVEANSIDFAQYMPLSGTTLVYRRKSYASGNVSEDYDILRFFTETVNSEEMLVEYTLSGSWTGDICYYTIDNDFVKYKGYGYDNGSGIESMAWFTPPIILGARKQYFGQTIPNHFVRNTVSSGFEYKTIDYREYQFIGIEDVMVPAGTFENCIKIIRRRSGGRYNIYFNYPGIGTVKNLYADSNNGGYIQELVNQQKADGSPLSNNVFCWATKNIINESNPDIVERWSMSYVVQQYPIHTTLNPLSPNPISLISQDGTTFTADPVIYPDNPPEVSLTVSGGIVSGNIGTFTFEMDHECIGN